MDGRSYREQTQYDLLGNICRKYGFGLFVQYGYAGRAGCGLSGVGGSSSTSSTQSAHQTQSLSVPGVLTLYNGHDVRGNMVDAGGARFYSYSVLNQATSIWRDNINNPSIRSRFAYGSDGQRYRRIDDGSTTGGTTTTTYIGSVERRQLPGGSIQWRRSVAGVVLIEHYGDTLSGGITQASGSGTTRHQFNDHLGSVQVIGSVSGSSITVLERLDTDAHGEWRTPSPPFGQAGSSHTSRGFTGHEHLNGLDTLHMNGRLYWASGGRMVQPDPIITDPLNPQNWNPYSYVMNNPLNLIDPSGYSFLSKYWRTIVAVVVTVYTGGMAASATSGWAAAGWAAGGGFVAGAIQTDSLRGGVYGAFSGLVFNGIGRAYGNMAQANAAAGARTLGSTGLTAGQFTGMIVANGAAGGVMSSLQGGKFGHGFASAGFTTGASPMIGQAGGSMAQGTAAALVGGTASVMTGGKFANGAVTSAFSYALSSVGRGGGGDEGGTTTCALGDCPGEQLIAGPLEYLTPTRVYFQAGPGVTYIDGHSWIADWSGASAGASAAQYWADLHVQTGNPMYAVPGMFASLWTPDTALQTAFTLGTAGGGSVGFRFGREITFGRNMRVAPFGNRTGHRYGELPHYHRRGIDPATGQTLPGQGIGRHRPWEVKSTDRSWWERF